MTMTRKVRWVIGFSPGLRIDTILGRAAGLIVDTPPSFASGVASDQRQKLIKACVDAFKSRYRNTARITLTDQGP